VPPLFSFIRRAYRYLKTAVPGADQQNRLIGWLSQFGPDWTRLDLDLDLVCLVHVLGVPRLDLHGALPHHLLLEDGAAEHGRNVDGSKKQQHGAYDVREGGEAVAARLRTQGGCDVVIGGGLGDWEPHILQWEVGVGIVSVRRNQSGDVPEEGGEAKRLVSVWSEGEGGYAANHTSQEEQHRS